MKNEYDFSRGIRGALVPTKGKTRITIYLDNAVLEAFRARAEKEGTGYQTMINSALKAYLKESKGVPITETRLRQLLTETLAKKRRLKSV